MQTDFHHGLLWGVLEPDMETLRTGGGCQDINDRLTQNVRGTTR